MNIKAKILDQEALLRIITRMSHEIIEKNKGPENLIIMGLRTRGEYLATRLRDKILSIENVDVPLGILDVTLYRDDFRTRLKQPEVSVSNITFDITDKNIVLVDDVLYTGRTIRSALCAIMDFGRPATIKLCCLVDRGHRQLPIKADIIGKNIPTSINEEVRVKLLEHDGEDAVYLVEV
ncbi:MAG: bifunctional pyr operon transcriptional regulator/uracil phosphoribosyltransferase PyrR [Ignavibacteriales bacterium]|jgi:pyrimidine operon attenuation protein/uracil phosphoribosyltransferase|nr:bifunctional pyr operon transcriptional regulator/uracil phosphoribosyltransferase PyrR [Ignavibacteriales bacterium]MBK7265264.1 bifunctional pyr operon transcriptional regulator/uracil phosphoribosyltransferase PyrR [Ignavibacteriales bacterium]MBK8661643.1 bifunctional pyr operon transcriptional regulator/uracil phosphoribosyltransferase PyrR [Ignavibacteriales bacterium]MBP9121700.1 bifunctional pyr operon transcriptional regulator/uracil phosphoribosyltransferase PyrR [Ignavibacteriaceae